MDDSHDNDYSDDDYTDTRSVILLKISFFSNLKPFKSNTLRSDKESAPECRCGQELIEKNYLNGRDYIVGGTQVKLSLDVFDFGRIGVDSFLIQLKCKLSLF